MRWIAILSGLLVGVVILFTLPSGTVDLQLFFAAVGGIFATWAVVLMYWFRPRTKLMLHCNQWKAQRENTSSSPVARVLIAGAVHASTPNALFAVSELTFTVVINGEHINLIPNNPDQLNYAEFGGVSRFVFDVPQRTGLDVLKELPIHVKVRLSDGTKGQLRCTIPITNLY